ncbi:MAG: glycosyltransferase family 2 protein [bacterium]|nr:glycosyltransferase family 2 protein [bacterium]
MNNAIVVLHYNKIRLTKNCVQSILDAGYPPELIHCFDNGSKQEVFDELKNIFPKCRHHRCEKNLGYSGGFNRALEWVFDSGFSGALFCTNDTRVYPGALETCAQKSLETGAGMIAPCVIYLSSEGKEEAIDSIGGWFNAETCTLNHYQNRGLPDFLDPVKDYIPGTALWINKEFFKETGGTDETFHMYWEDVDICFRAHQKGLAMARCYDAKIAHGVGQTVRKKPLYTTFYFHRNRIRFCKRYLKGDQLQKAMALLNQELLKMGEQWEQKNDQKRLNYLNQLMTELED